MTWAQSQPLTSLTGTPVWVGQIGPGGDAGYGPIPGVTTDNAIAIGHRDYRAMNNLLARRFLRGTQVMFALTSLAHEMAHAQGLEHTSPSFQAANRKNFMYLVHKLAAPAPWIQYMYRLALPTLNSTYPPGD